jgi:hypothetical protein
VILLNISVICPPFLGIFYSNVPVAQPDHCESGIFSPNPLKKENRVANKKNPALPHRISTVRNIAVIFSVPSDRRRFSGRRSASPADSNGHDIHAGWKGVVI